MTTYSVRGPHFRGPMTDTARLEVYEDGELVAEYDVIIETDEGDPGDRWTPPSPGNIHASHRSTCGHVLTPDEIRYIEENL